MKFKKEYIVLFILILFFIFPGCAEQKDKKKDLDQLRKTIKEFYEAINSDNADKRAEMFTDNAILMPNNYGIIKGKQTIEKVIKSGEKMVFRIKDLERLELHLSGNIAYTVNRYYYSYHQQGKEPVWHKTKNVHVWRKQADGTWKLHVDIWNSSGSSQ